MTSVAILHRDQILERVAAGEHLAAIAANLGVSAPAISKVLANDPAYVAARQECVATRLERFEAALDEDEAVESMVKLARVKAQLSQAQWRAECEFPERWSKGNRQIGPTSQTPMVQIFLAEGASATVVSAQQPTNARTLEPASDDAQR